MHTNTPYRLAPLGLLVLLSCGLLLGGCRRDMTVPEQPPQPRTGSEATTRSTSSDFTVETADGWQVFGEPDSMQIAADVAPVQISEVVADPQAYTGRPLMLQGTVTEVCQSKGCWLKMANDAASADEAVFVKFTCPVEGFLIPTDSVGKPVVVSGEVIVEEMSEEDARHIAEESGRPAAEVAKITGPQQVIRVLSPTAKVRV